MIARLPPELTVIVIPEDTVKGPVAVAFSVASIVVSTSTVCELTLNIPPFLKFLLFASGGTTEPSVTPRKLTKIFPVPDDGASEKTRLVPPVIE